jgi:phosphate-selective porin OprO/OprP
VKRALLLGLLAAGRVAAAADLTPTFMAQMDADVHADEGTNYDGFQLTRLRLGVRAEPVPWLLAVGVLEYDSGPDAEVKPFEAYLEVTAARSWHFSVGFRRTPLFHTAKDELIESLPIPELSLPVRALWPGVDLGVEAHYTPETVPLEAWLRVGNGSQSAEGNDGPDPALDARADLVLGRARPGREKDFWGLRVGAGGHAKYREDTSGLSDTTPDGFEFYHPAPTWGWQVLGESHIAAWVGRLSATLEGGIAREERSETAGGPTAPRIAQAPIFTAGGALELAWLAWGAPRVPGQSGVPGKWPNATPFSWADWRGGSLEVAARIERVDLEYGAPDVQAGGAEGVALAVDWWATPFAGLSLAAYDYHYLLSPVEEPGQTTFWLVMARATVSFR